MLPRQQASYLSHLSRFSRVPEAGGPMAAGASAAGAAAAASTTAAPLGGVAAGLPPRRVLADIGNTLRPTLPGAGAVKKPTDVGVGAARPLTSRVAFTAARDATTMAAAGAAAPAPGAAIDSALSAAMAAVALPSTRSTVPTAAASAPGHTQPSQQFATLLTVGPGEVADIDAKYRTPCINIFMVPEFINDIFAHLKQKERTDAVASTYMSSQAEITPAMRATLVDWLVNVCTVDRCAPETMYLCVRLLDRFLSLRSVQKSKLQLLGVVAYQIAWKVEEMYSYRVDKLVKLGHGQYRRDELLRMERYVLSTLGWNVTSATLIHFLQRYTRAAGLPRTSVHLASYLGELVLLDYGMLKYLPSMQAAACVMVTLRMTGCPIWTATLQHYTGFSEAEVRPAATAVLALRRAADTSSLTTVRKKYCGASHGDVAHIEAPGVL